MLSLKDLDDVGRIVALDGETTGHRVYQPNEISGLPKGLKIPGVIIQLGCVELLREDGVWTRGKTWETLVNPDGPLDPKSIAVHGIYPAQLKKAPRFRDIFHEFQSFIKEDVLLAHACANEIDFLNYELRRAGIVEWRETPFDHSRFLDTQVLAKSVFPGAPSRLDVLCDRLWIDRSHRERAHGALLDADLTAQAFIKIQSGFTPEEIRILSFL